MGTDRPGLLDEPVLEHQRRHDVVGAQGILTRQGDELLSLLDHAHGTADLARGVGGDPALHPHEHRGDVHRRSFGGDHGQPHVQARHEPVDLGGEPKAAVEHHAGEGRQRSRLVCEEGSEHDVLPVARDDDDGVVRQPVDDVRHRHRRDDEPECLAVEQLRVAVHE
jgi:hypothetical protein